MATKPINSPTIKPTNSPTIKPTNTPTIKPTNIPTIKPTNILTIKPTDIQSTNNELQSTANPTLESTVTRTTNSTETTTINPTEIATINPTEIATINPDFYPRDDSKLPHTGSFIKNLDNITILYFIFGTLFVFYLFICLYIWCNERRKRWHLKDNFQKENDIDRRARIAFNNHHHGGNQYGEVVELEYVEYEIDSYRGSNEELRQFDKQNVVFLDDYDDEEVHRQHLINEGLSIMH